MNPAAITARQLWEGSAGGPAVQLMRQNLNVKDWFSADRLAWYRRADSFIPVGGVRRTPGTSGRFYDLDSPEGPIVVPADDEVITLS